MRRGDGSWRVDRDREIAAIAGIPVDDEKIIVADNHIVDRNALGDATAVVTAAIATNIVGATGRKSATWIPFPFMQPLGVTEKVAVVAPAMKPNHWSFSMVPQKLGTLLGVCPMVVPAYPLMKLQ